MKKHIFFLLISLLCISNINAQQTKKNTRTWFPNPDVKIETPAFSRHYGFTTYKQMMAYLKAEADANPNRVSLRTVGKTQRGRDIPLVVVSNGQKDDTKLRVLYTGCVHGNEHAGTEGLLWFIHQLSADASLTELLDNIDFYILPMVNADGSEAESRATNSGIDPNRDQTRLSTPEVECMHRVATEISPQVFVDFHEFKPLRSSYEEISDRLISNPNDYMYLYSSNPNVYPALTEIIEQQFVPNAEQMARTWNLTTSTYFTTKSERQHGVVMNIGGQAARSSSNIMALRGAISMLMEIRGIGLGRTSYLRRVNTVYQLACSYARTAVANAADVRRITDEARNQQRDIVTRYSVPTVEDYPFEFLDLLSNQKVTIPVAARPAKDLVVESQVSRPEAYYISADAELAISLIDKFGIQCETLSLPTTLSLEALTVTDARVQTAEVLGINPISVKIETNLKTVNLPAGSVRIPMNQPLSTLAAILLEPECANGFVNFRVVKAPVGKDLPIYRSPLRAE